jgi:hypothetical protein
VADNVTLATFTPTETRKVSMNRKILWVRQIVTWLLVLVLSLSFVAEAQAGGDTQYKSLTGEKKFTEIQEQVTHTAKSVANYKASDAYKEIVNSLQYFQKLYKKVQTADHVDDVIKEVADGLDKIAANFEKVASLSTDILRYRKENFYYLRSINGETLKTEKQLKEQITKLESDNKYFKQLHNNSTDEIDSKRIEIKLKGNDSIIKSLQAQSNIWGKFYQKQAMLLEKLDLNGRKVDLLLDVLNVNAKVYHEAANVARLRQSAIVALDNLGYLTNMEDIIVDLQDSWSQVDEIVSEIGSADFIFDIQ